MSLFDIHRGKNRALAHTLDALSRAQNHILFFSLIHEEESRIAFPLHRRIRLDVGYQKAHL